ncbi:hypothetical protein [Candidatus Endomicrobiellum agilis]|uniref:hypothetical protein n=1 Tax=Candidatus Endomicrobiellum agilis TaxID=3238957 RepID=UPI003581F70E|nr:hypothetical protein [Endomicrobium sp.]
MFKSVKIYPAVGSSFISAASRRAVDRKRNALKYLKEAVFCACGNSVCELAAGGEIDLG